MLRHDTLSTQSFCRFFSPEGRAAAWTRLVVAKRCAMSRHRRDAVGPPPICSDRKFGDAELNEYFIQKLLKTIWSCLGMQMGR